MKRKRLLLVFPPLLFLAILGTRLLLNSNGDEESADATAVVARQPATGSVEEVIQYPGTLRPAGTVTVLPKTSGQIEAVHVREGMRINEGAIVVTLDRDTLDLQLDQAKASYQAAEAQYQKALKGVRVEEIENTRALVVQAEKELATAKKNMERARTLYDAGALPKTELEEAENKLSSGKTRLENAKRSLKLMEEGASDEELDMARSTMEAAKAQYDLVLLNYQNAVVRAPATGLVAKIFVEAGNMASPSVPLLAIVQDDIVFAEVYMPEKYFGRMHNVGAGLQARVVPIAYPEEKPFVGTITGISPIVDPENRTFTVEVAIENEDRKLRPGMYVNVDVVLKRVDNTMIIPESALLFRDKKHVVFIADGDGDNGRTARLREVLVGLRENGNAQILDGLSRQDKIIIRGNAFLEDGQNIRMVDG